MNFLFLKKRHGHCPARLCQNRYSLGQSAGTESTGIHQHPLQGRDTPGAVSRYGRNDGCVVQPFFLSCGRAKNLSDYIIDIRLGFAARLLVDSTMSIAEICYECGFNNLSNFNRIFKKKKCCSPKEFRENYRKKKKLI